MIRTVLKVIGVTLLVGYLLAAGILYGLKNPEPTYRAIEVHIAYPNDEAHFITEADVLQKLRSQKLAPVGKTFSEVNTHELNRLIEENPLIKSAACYHTPDSVLRIDVEQRNPVMRVKSLTSLGDFYIGHDGETMPALQGSAIHLPLTTGYVTKAHILPLHDFALFLNHHEFWRNEITQINILPNGDAELIPRVGDHTILVGSFDGIETKLDRVRKFYRKVMPVKGWNAYRVINAKFDGQIVGEK